MSVSAGRTRRAKAQRGDTRRGRAGTGGIVEDDADRVNVAARPVSWSEASCPDRCAWVWLGGRPVPL
ncbi:hypothetical protein KEM60_00271 [Austwickia sp. TVS 96-490-7B]|nr:hypothetical protein [Austwickia sp. TVS 96-490-7B]